MIADFKVKNNSEFTMKDRLLMERWKEKLQFTSNLTNTLINED
jgi:hypothetical protein